MRLMVRFYTVRWGILFYTFCKTGIKVPNGRDSDLGVRMRNSALKSRVHAHSTRLIGLAIISLEIDRLSRATLVLKLRNLAYFSSDFKMVFTNESKIKRGRKLSWHFFFELGDSFLGGTRTRKFRKKICVQKPNKTLLEIFDSDNKFYFIRGTRQFLTFFVLKVR